MGHHAHHMQMFKRKFWISLALTIPILLLSETIQMWLGLAWLKVPYQQEILLILSAIIYAYGGVTAAGSRHARMHDTSPSRLRMYVGGARCPSGSALTALPKRKPARPIPVLSGKTGACSRASNVVIRRSWPVFSTRSSSTSTALLCGSWGTGSTLKM